MASLPRHLRTAQIGDAAPADTAHRQVNRDPGVREHGFLCQDAHISGVAQWLACWAHNPKVRGSKPRSAMCAVGNCARAKKDPLPLVKCDSCSPFMVGGRPHIAEIHYRKNETKICVAKQYSANGHETQPCAPRTFFPLFHSPLLTPAIVKIILSFELPLMQ